MSKKTFKSLAFIFIAILVTAGFFYKSIFFGQIPFPGDLLLAEYKPWSSYSYFGYNPGAVPHKAQYFDTLRQIYPWKTLSLDQLKRRSIPLWNPYNFSGAPLLANIQSQVLYPLNGIYFFTSQPVGWTVTTILQIFLALIFMYIYGKSISLSSLGAAFSSLAFAFSMYMIVFLEYNTIGQVILWLPLILYCLEAYFATRKFRFLLLLPSGIYSSFTAGHLQLFGIILVFTLFYLILKSFQTDCQKRFSIIFTILFFFVLALAFSGPQLLPTLELIANSARASQPYDFLIEKLLIQPKQLLMYLVPDIFGNPATRNYLLADTYPGKAMYVGLSTLIFAFTSLLLFKKSFYTKVFSITAFSLLLFIVRSPLTELFYKIEILIISTSSPTNVLFLVSFSISILAGFGLDYWLKSKNKQPIIFNFLITVLIILIILSGKFSPGSFSLKNLYYSLGISFLILLLLFLYKLKHLSIIIMLLITLTALDFFYFFHKFNPFVPQEFVYPDARILTWIKNNASYNRFWGYGAAEIQANFAMQYQLFSPDGYDPLYPKWYGEFIASSEDGRLIRKFTNKNRSDAVIQPGFGEYDFSNNIYRKKVLDLLGVIYILDRAENQSTINTFPPGLYEFVTEEDGWKIYKNLSALPRVFLVSQTHLYQSKEEFEALFFDPNFNPRDTLLVDKPLKVPNDPLGSEEYTQIQDYKPGQIIIQANTNSERVLFLSDTYYPGWNAYIDNVKTPVYKAHYAFRAVKVPRGNHLIVMKYEPDSFSIGFKLRMIGIIGITVYFVQLLIRKRSYAKG